MLLLSVVLNLLTLLRLVVHLAIMVRFIEMIIDDLWTNWNLLELLLLCEVILFTCLILNTLLLLNVVRTLVQWRTEAHH